MSFVPIPVSEMRILFVGARIVGYRVLSSLLEAEANIVGLLTLDEKKSAMTTAFTSFDDLTESRGIATRKFTNLRDSQWIDWVRELRPDLGIVVGVSQLISETMLTIPPRGFIGMHPTLLPHGRGRAPIPWTLIKGLDKTGVSLFYCDPQADSGDLLVQKELPVYYEDVSATLGQRSDDAAIELFLNCLPQLAAGAAPRIPQDDDCATVWPQRRPEDGLINWDLSPRELYNWVRGLSHPYPGAFSYFGGRKIFVWSVRESFDCREGSPGEVLAVVPHGVLVACRDGAVLVTCVSWEDGEDIAAEKSGLQPGDRLYGENR